MWELHWALLVDVELGGPGMQYQFVGCFPLNLGTLRISVRTTSMPTVRGNSYKLQGH